MSNILPPGVNYAAPLFWPYGPAYGYYDEDYEEKKRISGLKDEITILESIAAKATKRTTLDIIFNRLCACNATIAAIVLSRP